MIAHFLHGGGGEPVWSNRAQLPHLDLTFPLAPSLILFFSLSLAISDFLPSSYVVHTILTPPQRGLTCPFWVLSDGFFLCVCFPWPLWAAFVCQLDLCAQMFSFAWSFSQVGSSIHKSKFLNSHHVSMSSHLLARRLSRIVKRNFHTRETYGCLHLGLTFWGRLAGLQKLQLFI